MGLRDVPIIKNNSKRPPELPQSPFLYEKKSPGASINFPQMGPSFLNNSSKLEK